MTAAARPALARVRRLARHLFTLCSAASLVLCVTVCVLWVRSYSVCDAITNVYVRAVPFAYDSDLVFYSEWYDVVHCRGHVSVIYGHPEQGAPGSPAHDSYPASDATPDHLLRPHERRLLGFRYNDDFYLSIPDYALALLFGVLPIASAVRMLRRRRRGHLGLCARCGYDLRATPACCPECGTTSAPAEEVTWAAVTVRGGR